MNCKFILVKDKKTKDKLLSLNYHLILDQNNCYVFENKDTVTFDLDKTQKYILTNKLFL